VSGTTLDTGALTALEAGSPRMRALVRLALAESTPLAIPAGVLARAWRASTRQARLAQLLRASITEVVVLDREIALKVGRMCAASGASDVVDVSVVVCARERGQPVVTSDPGDLAAIDSDLTVLSPN
jgi:hypothetical protein